MIDPQTVNEARAIANDPALRDCLYLTSKGVPFDVAFSLDTATRLAWCVILGEVSDGGTFSWDRMTWEKRDG